MRMSCGGAKIRKRPARTHSCSSTHDFEVASLVRRAFWAGERALQMEGRLVNEVDLHIRRLVVLAVCEEARVKAGYAAISWYAHQRSPCLLGEDGRPWRWRVIEGLSGATKVEGVGADADGVAACWRCEGKLYQRHADQGLVTDPL